MATITVPVVNTREVAAEAREFAREHGLEVGTRGRLSREVFVSFFMATPQRARDVAGALGVDISKRGRLAWRDADRVAALIR